MKYYYIAVTVQENGKNYAYMVRVSDNTNLLSALKIKGIIYANIYNTKKDAECTVAHWNACYKLNGSYMFEGVF